MNAIFDYQLNWRYILKVPKNLGAAVSFENLFGKERAGCFA